MTKETVWEKLSRIDVSKHTEDKNGYTYLSWAWAWSTLKDNYPDAKFTKHQNEATGLPFFKDPDTGTAYVVVTVTASDQSATEVFPVLDYSNKPIQSPSAFHVNTALQRCLAKAISYLGLGAYIYAGEDLPPLPKVAEIVGPDGEKKQGTGVEVIAKIFHEFIPTMNTNQKLEDFWRKNTTAVEIMKAEGGTAYGEVLAAFKKRKQEIIQND